MNKAVAASRNEEATSQDGTPCSNHLGRGRGLSQTSLHLSQSDSSFDDLLLSDQGQAACGPEAAPEERLLQDPLRRCPALIQQGSDARRGPVSRAWNSVGADPVGARLLGTSVSVATEPASPRHSFDTLLTIHPHHEPCRHVLPGDNENSYKLGNEDFACFSKALVHSPGGMLREAASPISVPTSDLDCESIGLGTSSDLMAGSCSIGGSSCSSNNTRWWPHHLPPGSPASTVDTANLESIYHADKRLDERDHVSVEGELGAEEVFLEDLLVFLQEQQVAKEALADEELRRVFLTACVKTPRPSVATDSPPKHALAAPLPMTQPVLVPVPKLDLAALARSQSGPLPSPLRSAFDRPLKPWVPGQEVGLLAPSSSVPTLRTAADAGLGMRTFRTEVRCALHPCSEEVPSCVAAAGMPGASPVGVLDREWAPGFL